MKQKNEICYGKEDLYLYQLMSREIEEKLLRTACLYQTKFPHVSRQYQYIQEENALWTAAFYPGMMYLAYDLTGEEGFLRYTDKYLDSFETRLSKKIHITHDLGFLYTLSSVACYKLTGNTKARAIAEQAADMLAKRYHSNGKYIQAWNKMEDKTDNIRIIIDTMMNLPLLYWTGNERYCEIAENHAMTSADCLVRNDYSTFHTYWMDRKSGEAVRGATHQGFSDNSTWARGQAWAVYGFALSYSYTKNQRFLEVAVGTAEFFIENLPEDGIPYWDFSFTDDTPDRKDTSAAAILLCGLLELTRWVDADSAGRYKGIVFYLVRKLFDGYFSHDPDTAGVLKESMYHRDDGAMEYTSWGDYFFFEALVRLQKDWNRFW